MSGDMLRYQDEDQYFYTAQHDQSRDGPAFNGGFVPYQTSQAQNDIQNTTQYTQTVNNHAFNTNSQSSTQTSHDISHLQDAVRPPSYGRLPPGAYDSMPAPLALPGLLNAISAQRSKAEPRVTRENQIHAVSTTAVDGESIEQAGSDLEEGELSEGIDPKSHLAHTPSRPRSAQQLSHTAKGRNTRGTPGGRPSASPHTAPDSDRLVQSTTNSNGLDASGDASMRHRQPSQMESSTVHLTANGRVNTSSTGRVHSPPIQQQPNKSSKVIKRGARRAVKQMRPHNIGYLQLIKEHIDMDLLKDLYAELKITVPEATHPGAFSANTETRTGLPAHYLDSDSQNPALAQSTDNLVPIADNLEPRQHYTFKAQSPLDQQGTHGAEAAEATSDGVSHEIHEDRADHSKGSNTVSEKAVTERLPLQTETGTNMGLAVAHSHDKTTTTSPAINGREPPTTQVTPQAPLQPSSTTSASKPPAPKLTAKPVDRKDYVARLLAAKAGKALPASNAPRPPPAPIPQKMGQDSASGPSHQAGKVHESDSVQIPDKDAPKEASALSKKVQNAAPQKSAADEAKKRAQTELARRKIEELKQRSEALKRSSSSVNEVPESSATKQLPPVEKPTQGHSVAITSSSTGSPTVQNTPRHSYFPLQNVPFALPGLFMSGQQNQPEQPSEPLRVASILEESQQGEEPKSVTAEAPDTGAGLHQRVAKVETFAPSKGENKVTIQTQRVEATTFEAISNPRKRPTAADFIEAMPAKSRRLNTSTADNNVVFDITDDEADESICDASEMQLDGEHGVRPNLEREPQISRSGSTGKPSVPQHPALNDPYTKAEQVKSTPSVALQVSQGPLKHTAPGGLRYNEEEIARMKRKIAEMEERRKLKQNASPAQTAGTPGQITSSVKPSDNYVNAFSTPGVIRCLSEETGHVEDREQTLGHVPNLDSTFQEESPSGQQGRQIEGTEEAQLLAESVNGPTTGLEERQQRQRRKAEIESRIPSMSATIEEYLSRLQKLQKEEADVQAQIQKQMNDKRALQEELDRLLQLSPSIMEESLQKGQEATTPQPIATQLQDADPSISQQGLQDEELAPAGSLTSVVHEASQNEGLFTEPDIAPEPSTPQSTISSEAPTDQSLVSGELAEDVMDISGSEDGNPVTNDSPVSNANTAPPATESESEEPYEPPQSFGPVDETSTIPADSKQQHPGHEKSSQRIAQDVKPSTPAVGDGGTSGMRDVEDASSVALPPGPVKHAPSLIELSDSDDYEPPEPMSSVDAEPLTNDAATTTSQSSFSPSDANRGTEVETISPDQLPAGKDHTVDELAEAALYDSEKLHNFHEILDHGHYTPYESPLQRFHAYRYHPEFVSRVGNGYRSLTYSHNIDARKPVCPYEIGGRCNDASCDNQHFKSMNLSDDLILVQMGAVPEGLSAEQKDSFVVGLRQIIQEIRGRKVKDFGKVASEIAAYRTRFLGDSSKILPL